MIPKSVSSSVAGGSGSGAEHPMEMGPLPRTGFILNTSPMSSTQSLQMAARSPLFWLAPHTTLIPDFPQNEQLGTLLFLDELKGGLNL